MSYLISEETLEQPNTSKCPYFTTEYIDSSHELHKIIEYFKENDNITNTNMEDFDRKDLLDIGKKYMETKGYNNFFDTDNYYDYVRSSNSLIERWVYTVEGKQESVLDEHHDDNGGVSGCVDTLILYYRFDEGVEGGDLNITLINPMLFETTSPTKIIYRVKQITIDPRPTQKGICVLCIRGDVEHKIETMYGSGQRCCIVLQYPCLRK